MTGELVLVHAVEINPISIYGVMMPALPMSTVDLQGIAQERLGAALEHLGVRAQTHVAVGPPGPALLHAATLFDAELLVVGAHGRTGLTRFLLGSVAETVVHHASCSVLVARLA